jgi:hypothetical protein
VFGNVPRGGLPDQHVEDAKGAIARCGDVMRGFDPTLGRPTSGVGPVSPAAQHTGRCSPRTRGKRDPSSERGVTFAVERAEDGRPIAVLAWLLPSRLEGSEEEPADAQATSNRVAAQVGEGDADSVPTVDASSDKDCAASVATARIARHDPRDQGRSDR